MTYKNDSNKFFGLQAGKGSDSLMPCDATLVIECVLQSAQRTKSLS